MQAPKLAVFGVPTAAGARGASVSRAPLVFRDSGLLAALAADGTRVVNLSDLSLFPFRVDEAHPRARNAEGVACAVRTAADEMSRALAEGFTLVLGGDWVFLPGLALLIAVGGSAAALLLGFAGILRALSSKAADHLRNE